MERDPTIEMLRKMTDREVLADRWLAEAKARSMRAEAGEWARLADLLAAEADRRARVLADLDRQMG